MTRKVIKKIGKKRTDKNTHNRNKKKITKKINNKKIIQKKRINVASNEGVSKNLKKIIVVHGWSGDINKGWFPWLKKTLESQGFKVIMEKMLNADKPKMDVWIEQLKNISGKIDEQTYFVGHSIGCQTIIRMLEKHQSEKVGGAIFLAGWFNLNERTYKEDLKSEIETRKIAAPWVNTTIDFTKVQPKFSPGTITAIFSDNDPYVDLNNAEAFKQKLDARIVIENSKGHFSEEEIDNIPILLEEILRITKNLND
jgi:uncharacterized protein